MVCLSISGLLSWGNLAVRCQAPLDGLRPRGKVSGRFFLERFHLTGIQQASTNGGFSHGEHG
jgi:hypothetical protein